jgi:hypothetical protein
VRIHPTNDWHTDIPFNEMHDHVDVDADVIVHLGDLRAPGELSVEELRAAYPDQEHLLYVLGNHDFYSEGNPKKLKEDPRLKTTWEEQRIRAAEAAKKHGVTLLDDAVCVINDVRFIGATLWTDMMMRPSYMSHSEAMRSAGRMNDYRLGKTGRGRSHDTLRPSQTIEAHKVSRKFIEKTLAEPFAGETVVCTHHAPSRMSLRDPAVIGELDWCYASDLEFLMHLVGSREVENSNLAPTHIPPSLWLHAHVHKSLDYNIGFCRVVCNARGYPLLERANSPRENPDFDPQLVIKVGYDCTPKIGGM